MTQGQKTPGNLVKRYTRRKICTFRSRTQSITGGKRTLKKAQICGREDETPITLPASQKYNLIRSVIKKYSLKHMVSYLCTVTGVSRSGYYNYFSLKSREQRKQKDKKNEKWKRIILKAFHFKRHQKRARQI
ncbi:transposase [Bacillus cereus HuB4-4]|uniref:Transposase n=1 Tax=Bacillus cereus HuB4-4 TaxID=1053211 RepID=A0A9W5QNA8_BACCE|nr:transposase [Bacillus cereus HuB4-4]